MADVFFSYTHSERDRLLPMVERMKSLGLTVWFDVDIPAGSTYEDVITQELERASAIVVCWSKASIKSKWVRSEASLAQDQGTMVPCFLELCPLKPPFNITQTEDLSTWAGETASPAWRKLIERIGSLVERPGLVGLMDALADETGESLAGWTELYRDDPFVSRAKAIWADRQRDLLSRRTASALDRLNDALERHRARIMMKFDALSEKVEAWLLAPGAKCAAERPDPDRLAAELLNSSIQPGPLDTTETLKTALHSIDEYKNLIHDQEYSIAQQALKTKELGDELLASQANVDRLQSELSRLGTRTAPRPGYRLVPWCFAVLGSVAVVCLLFEIGATRSSWAKQSDNLRTEISSYQLEIASLRRTANQTISDLQIKNTDLIADQKNLTAQRDADNDKLQAAQDQIATLNRRIHAPPVFANASADFCNKHAGSLFDKDNPTQQGITDTYTLDDATLQKTVAACSSALGSTTDSVTKRRITAQLGRAHSASAVRQRQRFSNEENFRSEMQVALNLLEEAEQEGSAYAKVLLASYYNGLPGWKNDPELIALQDRNRAFKLYKQAADAGNVIAITDLASMKLDATYTRSFDDADIEELLSRAEAQRYPRAFETHANAWLNVRFHSGTSIDDRRKNAAALIAQEECLGYVQEADDYYKSSPLLARYRVKPACNDIAQAR